MDDAQYDKRFTNRNRIMATNGWTWISVPINKDHKFLPNSQVEINTDVSWEDEHWKKIRHSYANAKYFKQYEGLFKDVYEKKWKYLFDLNFETLKKIIGALGIKIEIIKSSELHVSGTSTQRLVDICKAVGADAYVSGSGGRNYMDESLFSQNNVKLMYQNYASKPYPQRLSASFMPDLSIIDMLVNVGPESMRIIAESGSGLVTVAS